MLTIRRSEVPIYLHDSDFYLSLNPDDDAELSIPEHNCKPDDSVNDEKSLRHLLATVRFWGLNIIPDTLYNFAMGASGAALEAVASDFHKELTYLPMFLKLRSTKPQLHMNLAAESGSLELIKFLLRHGHEMSAETTKVAAENGHLKCLQFLHSIHCPWNTSTAFAAARGGHFECLRFAHTHGCAWSDTLIAHPAAAGGHLKCLQYVAEKGCALDKALYIKAANAESIDCVQYLHTQSVPFPDSFVHHLVSMNNLRCLEFALQHGCTFHDNTLIVVQSIECLHILYNADHYWTAQSAAWAASKSLTVLKFLHERRCPWDETTYLRALESHSTTANNTSNIDCLVYAHQNGCPWSRETSLQAVRVGNAAAVEYLLTHGCPFDVFHPPIAATFNNVKLLSLLHTRGIPWDELTTTSAANSFSLNCLKYACSNGCPMAEDICLQPANLGQAAIVIYLVSMGCRGYPIADLAKVYDNYYGED